MTAVPGARLTLPTKLVVVAATTQLIVLAIIVAIARATDGATLGVRILALAAPLSIPLFVVFFLTRWIVERTTVPLVTAYRRVAAGDFRAELPPLTAGSDFIAVRAAFAAMGAALERSTAALREADLERRRLFADLAHELATPTTTLLGIAQALRDGTGEPGRLLDHLEHESARLARLIADVREVAHLEDPALPMQLEACDLGELAARAVERARLAAPAGCELRCAAAPAPAEADRLRIEQVFANLLGNAVRHAAGGVVALEVRPDGGEVVLRVEDSGSGVPDELLPQLGRRLLRVDPSRSRDTGGHGLGLSIVRGIVDRHRGRVTFSRAGLGGLAVEVRLPRRIDQE